MPYELVLNSFEADEIFKKSFKDKVSDLLDVSPSDANARSDLTKTDAGFLGVLQVISSQGKFVVESAAQDLDILANSLFHLMHRKMRNWRMRRFLTN